MTELNRRQIAEQIAYLEALAEQAKKAAEVHRARLESTAGDEYRKEGAAPSWSVKDLVTIYGRVSNSQVAVGDPADFLAWVKAHKPDEVEVIERVRPVYQSAVLKGCSLSDDGQVVTAGGDEIAGVRYIPGGTFLGIGCKFDSAAKQTYGEVAREALSRIALAPSPVEPGTEPSVVNMPVPDAVAAFLDPPPGAPALSGGADPWASAAGPDPWANADSPS